MKRSSLRRDISDPNKSGPSLENFVSNIKGIPAALKEVGSAIKTGTLGNMLYSDMNDMGKNLVDKFRKK